MNTSDITFFFLHLFDTSQFPARWFCGEWSTFHGWLYISANLIVWGAYFVIPFIMFRFALRRNNNIPFKKVFYAFILFILFCGATHFLDAIIFWFPHYRLNALLLSGTALVSVYTVVGLIKVLPEALLIKNPKELEKINEQLLEALKARDYADYQLRMDFELSTFGKAHVDFKGNFIRVNRAFCQLLGYESEELLKMGFKSITHPDDTDKEKNILDSLINSEDNSLSFENRYLRKDGSIVWVMLHSLVVRDEIGNPSFIVTKLQDITEQKEVETQLEKNKERFELVIQGVQAGIWDWTDTNVPDVWWSPKFYQLLGYSPASLPSGYENFFSIMHPDDIERVEKTIADHFDYKKDYNIEYRLKTANGRYKWFLGSGQAKFNKKGEPVRMAGSIIDIDRVKKIEKELSIKNLELERSNKDLVSFSYSVSHDLKAPLRAISGFSNILLEDHVDSLDESAKKHLQVIIKNASKMGDLINDILSYSRVSRGETKIVDLNMRELFIEILNENIREEKGREIYFKVGELKNVKGDQVQIRQLIGNIISNAIKYTRPVNVAKIEVVGVEIDEDYVYKVTDNGVGFDMAYVDKVFQIFERLHLSRDFEGTGVGLAIVKRIVEKHQGKVWIESTLNKNTSIYFTLSS